MFLFQYDCADIFAFVVQYIEIYAFNELSLDVLLFGANSVDVVGVLIWGNYPSPGPLEGLPHPFHQQEIMINYMSCNKFITLLFPELSRNQLTIHHFIWQIKQQKSRQDRIASTNKMHLRIGVSHQLLMLILIRYQLPFLRRIYIIPQELFYMTEILVAEQQLELVNIVEIVQTKLARNFKLLLKRIDKTDQTITQHQENNQNNLEEIRNAIKRIEHTLIQQQTSHTQAAVQTAQKISSLEEAYMSFMNESKESSVSVKRLNDELFRTQIQFEEKLKKREEQLEEAIQHIQNLALQQNRLNDEVNKKENKVEAERLVKETEILKDKNSHIETQIKMANHKIEKMEILNQKAERLQAKKEVEIMKEIEEKVKKQLKIGGSQPANSQGFRPTDSVIQIQTSSGSSTPINTGINATTNLSNPPKGMEGSLEYQNLNNQRRTSIVMQDFANGNDNFMRGNIDNIIEKWGEKIKLFQIQFKEINENLKILNRSGGTKKTEANKQNSEGIRDKVNEIKPELVKLWAKLDTIDDRLGFNERKLEDKMKGVNELAQLIKENSVSRLEQKMKNLQTQIFTNLKQIKAKLETKVSQTDYDKYRQNMEDRITQINQLIYLKSDKLEVKKALLFLQSKIKEIILVISEDQENEKDALLTKKQLKCISCDKDIDKFSGLVTSPKGNWDSLPYKDHPPEILGRFGMTNFGSLAKKIKKLESKDLPVLNKRNVNSSFQNS